MNANASGEIDRGACGGALTGADAPMPAMNIRACAQTVTERAKPSTSEFLSRMSRELRSPLNEILGFAQLMESGSAPTLPAETESIARILQAGRHLLALIDEAIDPAETDSKEVQVSRKPGPPDGVLAPATSYVQSGTRRRTVLYVEDDPANMKLVEQLIARRPDIALLTATTGKDGVELARATRPAAILMDINLPDITGYEALLLLREDPVTADIPVVAISANALPHDTRNGFRAGFFRYLTKPIKINEFMDTLNAVIEFAEQGESPRG